MLRWLAAPLAAAVFLAGVWVAGGLVTDDFRASMALTGAWFVLAGAACVAAGRARRGLLVPLLGGYLVAAVAVGAYLAATTLADRVVDERVAVARDGNVEEAAGAFVSGEHATRGMATVVRLRDGRRVLTLTGFDTAAGPDLRVRVAPGATTDGGADGVVDVGALKGNRGNQQYELPAGTGADGATVIIWCRAFSALFGSAPLRAS
jgi:hypothetical protein